jgi:hypothetical protein
MHSLNGAKFILHDYAGLATVIHVGGTGMRKTDHQTRPIDE